VDVTGLLGRLRRQARGALRADDATRELYAVDASLYRRRPAAVLRAAGPEDLEAAVDACRATGVPLTMRSGGTSLAGQALGRGLVVDCSALSAVAVDPDARTARVGPGLVLDALNAAAAVHGLTFGPDVATANRATLGGMIANNSAGARSVVHGLTADHVLALDVVLADGTRATLRRGGPVPPALAALRPLGEVGGFPALRRRVSGYNVDALAGGAPDWPRLLVGSEGTLAVTLAAEVALVALPPARALALVAYPSVDAALEAVPEMLATGPSAVELMDRDLLDPANRAPAEAALLGFAGRAAAMLVVEHQGEAAEAAARCRAIPGARVVDDPAGQAAVWAVRRQGIARALGVAGDERPIPFVEDPAVPPERLAAFAREFRRLLDQEGLRAVWYGHASVGCLHVRPLMDLRRPGEVARLRRVAEATADLVAAHGGSLSGEHGDGRLRGELLPRMYAPPTMAAFRSLKRALDPDGILNPGVIIDPEPLDEGLRLPGSPPRRAHRTAVSFGREGGLGRAVEACNGNGACRRQAGTMCPSFQALGDERHATRGRAVLLRAAIEGRMPGGLAGDGLHEALELCLACKACAAECPAQVDMARLKAEALAHRHRERGVPLRARALGATHALLAAGSLAPPVARLGSRLGARRAGRALPAPVGRWRPPAAAGPGEGRPVALMADTFTRFLHPEVGDAALRVLAAAGARVQVVVPGCCGRPALSQGLVGQARRSLLRTLDRLAPLAMAGVPIAVLEPSCWSMLTDDGPALLEGDPRARWVADAAVPFERLVAGLGPPAGAPITGEVLLHDHCHARALGAGDDAAAALTAAGAAVRPSGAGCCGMAGAFGYLHPALSRDIAADRLLPAVAAAGGAAVVAPGTSCRQQIAELAGVRALHPAEYLAQGLRSG
jgi:FAD/FMN-containing dehydrogenase/Fe-S oxidoreductase